MRTPPYGKQQSNRAATRDSLASKTKGHYQCAAKMDYEKSSYVNKGAYRITAKKD